MQSGSEWISKGPCVAEGKTAIDLQGGSAIVNGKLTVQGEVRVSA